MSYALDLGKIAGMEQKTPCPRAFGQPDNNPTAGPLGQKGNQGHKEFPGAYVATDHHQRPGARIKLGYELWFLYGDVFLEKTRSCHATR